MYFKRMKGYISRILEEMHGPVTAGNFVGFILLTTPTCVLFRRLDIKKEAVTSHRESHVLRQYTESISAGRFSKGDLHAVCAGYSSSSFFPSPERRKMSWLAFANH